ncbi:predicted protein [Chaetoceros tenuissimus]|uniref:Uncharacterized protein n=1 Tax=Chaetoceros tenuissimus TaxID=426638 RepID=A0AAD3HEZ1_9STRA|nr:predicted protein [Chaetoceros tenuissimus]
MGQAAAPFIAENAVFYITKRITIPGDWPQQELINYLEDCYEILILLPDSHFTVTNYNTEQKDAMKNNVLICAQQRRLKTQLLAQPNLLEKTYEEVKKEVIKTCGNIQYVHHTSDINPGRFIRQQGSTPCIHCRGINHRSHQCYFVVGFPERHHSRPQYFAPPGMDNQMRRQPVLNQQLFQQQGNNNAWRPQGNNNAWRPQGNVPAHNNNNYNRTNTKLL